MGNQVVHELADEAVSPAERDVAVLRAFGEENNWSPEQVAVHQRVFNALYSDDNRGFEYSFVKLRASGVPGTVLHRLWLFAFFLADEKHNKNLLGGLDLAGLDLDDVYHVLPKMKHFDPEEDETVLKSAMVLVGGGVGGAAQARGAGDPRVKYAVFDQFERSSERQMTPLILLKFLTFMSEMTGSKRRKFLWCMFSVNGRMYPGRFLQLGYETAQAFGTTFTEADVKAIDTMVKLTPRHFLSYTEYVAWWKVHDIKENSASQIRNAFTLIPYFSRIVMSIKQSSVPEGKEFAGKIRLGHDPKGIDCVVAAGLMTMRHKHQAPRVYQLRGAFVAPDSNSNSVKTVIFQSSDGNRIRIKCTSMMARNQLMRAIRSSSSNSHSNTRFQSFHATYEAPVNGNWFVDGEMYFETLMQSLLSARKEILIADWSFQPELYLSRGPGAGPHCRLDNILRKMASQGVQIRILLWWEVQLAVNGSVNSQRVGPLFADEENIRVLAHPLNNVIGRWSHHQKFVVIDRQEAFLGGLDLCFGRYDTQSHPLTDENHLAMKFPGKDFYNPNLVVNAPLDEPFVENLDRSRHIRQPWHDVHVQLDGQVANAVAYNFAQRWNMILSELNTSEGTLPLERGLDFYTQPIKGHPIQAQVLRSLSSWSGPESETECSIMNAYIHLIESAQHYIYIENQFFISSIESVGNEIGAAIVARVARAIEDSQHFKVILIVPLHAEGAYNTTTPRIITLYTQQTLQRMQSLLKETWPQASIWEYMSVHFVMNHAVLKGVPYLSMIYVHSKFIMADDRMAIVGSANINDRSMLGDRDSEIAVFLQSVDEYDGTMNGEPWKCSKMLWDWRMSLWREHLGENYLSAAQLADPFLGAKFFEIFSEYNQLLAEPIIDLDPQRLWRAVQTGLENHVQPKVLKKLISDWLMGLRPTKLKALCSCCKHLEAIPDNVCVLCDETLCDACCMSHDSAMEAVSASRASQSANEVTGRKNAMNPISAESMRRTLEMATDESEADVILCHLCIGHIVCPRTQKHGDSRSRESFLQGQPGTSESGAAHAEFKVRHLLKDLDLPHSDDIIERLKHRCYGDRRLLNALLSSDVLTRLDALHGHVFPYPIHYTPKIKPDLVRAAPKEIFL